MQPNPIKALLRSRKVMLLLLDSFIGLAGYFVGKYAGASSQDILIVIGTLQPVFVIVIKGITDEDVAKSNAEAAASKVELENMKAGYPQ